MEISSGRGIDELTIIGKPPKFIFPIFPQVEPRYNPP